MGVELHITRADFWADNESAQISADEWLAYVARDPELEFWPRNGKHFVLWRGESKYEEPWLDWFQGNVSTKWPDTALFRKMLFVASELSAQVQDDDGRVYSKPEDWDFDPTEVRSTQVPPQRSWWQRLLG